MSQNVIGASTSTGQSAEQNGPAQSRASAEGRILLLLRDAIDRLILWVSSRYDKALEAEERQQLDHLGEQVGGLMLAAGIPKPDLPRIINPLTPYGPTHVPIFQQWRRNGETVLAGGVGQQWEAVWRTVRIAADTRLAALDAQAAAPSECANRFGKSSPPCPGCGSPPAANGNLDDEPTPAERI